MRSLLSLCLIFFVLNSFAQNDSGRSIPIADALGSDLIQVTAKGNENSPHYIQPLILQLKNTSEKPLTIALKAGQIFNSEDPDMQDIILTDNEMIALKAGESLDQPIFGMCIQEYNGAPNDQAIYTLGKMAEGNLATVAGQIKEKKAYGIAAQQAIWAITDGRPLEEIAVLSPEETDLARELVSDLINSETTIVQGETIRRRNPSGLIKRQMEGNFKYRLSKESKVHIAFFNEQNIVVKELFNDTAVAAGEHKFDYTLDAVIDPTKFYYVRLIIDGEIKIDFEMEPRRG